MERGLRDPVSNRADRHIRLTVLTGKERAVIVDDRAVRRVRHAMDHRHLLFDRLDLEEAKLLHPRPHLQPFLAQRTPRLARREILPLEKFLKQQRRIGREALSSAEALREIVDQRPDALNIVAVHVHTNAHRDSPVEQALDILDRAGEGIFTGVTIALSLVMLLIHAVERDLNLFELPFVARMADQLRREEIAVAHHGGFITDAGLIQHGGQLIDRRCVAERLAAKPVENDLALTFGFHDICKNVRHRFGRHRQGRMIRLETVKAARVTFQSCKNFIERHSGLSLFREPQQLEKLHIGLRLILALRNKKMRVNQFRKRLRIFCGQLGRLLRQERPLRFVQLVKRVRHGVKRQMRAVMLQQICKAAAAIGSGGHGLLQYRSDHLRRGLYTFHCVTSFLGKCPIVSNGAFL